MCVSQSGTVQWFRKVKQQVVSHRNGDLSPNRLQASFEDLRPLAGVQVVLDHPS